MREQRTHTKQLRAPLTTTPGYPKSTQCNFNSCSFNCWLDYSWFQWTLQLLRRSRVYWINWGKTQRASQWWIAQLNFDGPHFPLWIQYDLSCKNKLGLLPGHRDSSYSDNSYSRISPSNCSQSFGSSYYWDYSRISLRQASTRERLRTR